MSLICDIMEWLFGPSIWIWLEKKLLKWKGPRLYDANDTLDNRVTAHLQLGVESSYSNNWLRQGFETVTGNFYPIHIQSNPHEAH